MEYEYDMWQMYELLLMAEILHHLGWCWNPINNGINYQPQLVFSPDFRVPSTVGSFYPFSQVIDPEQALLSRATLHLKSYPLKWPCQFQGACVNI